MLVSLELRRALHGLLTYRFGVHVVAEGRRLRPLNGSRKMIEVYSSRSPAGWMS